MGELPDTARCRTCSYLLRGLPDPVCPECGTPFDPQDPLTYNDPARPRSLRPLRPPSLIHVILLCVLNVAVLVPYIDAFHKSNHLGWACTGQGPTELWPALQDLGAALRTGITTFLGELLSCIPWWIPAADYIARLIALRRCRARRPPSFLTEFNRHRWRWRTMTICIILCYVYVLYPLPGGLRFLLSWPALSARADRHLREYYNPTGAQYHEWVGLWQVEWITGHPSQGFVFFQLGHDADVRLGITRYSVPPSSVGHGDRQWIAPGWYFERW